MLHVNVRAIVERAGPAGTEILLQVRDRAGERPALELPGGRPEEFEPILDGLAREVLEETGLRIVAILDPTDSLVHVGRAADVECLTPFCVYQTLRGPVDSVGFYFRCGAEGELIEQGDGSHGHRWLPLAEIAATHAGTPDAFDWLTQGALAYYLRRFAPARCASGETVREGSRE